MTPRLPEVGGWTAPAPSTKCARGPSRSGRGGLPLRLLSWSAAAGAALFLAACAATQAPDAVAHTPGTPGFLLGLWHGFIFPVAWIISLFADKVAVYAVPNDGGWYDFGYFLGIVVFGVGARKSHVVYRDRVIEARRIN
jgi:hypothetical protein